MKKSSGIIATVAFLLSSVALAGQEPAVGNSITYKERVVFHGKETIDSWTKVIQEVDSTGQSFLVKWTQGQREKSAWLAKSVLMYVDDVTKFCDLFKDSDFSRSIEKVQTPAGEFNTCRLDKPNYTVWYSNEVPFGMVKEINNFDDGDSVEHVVSGFRW